MWQSTQFASNGVRDFAEKGEAWTLMKEVETAGERIQSVYGVISAPAAVRGTGQMHTEFEVFSRLSFVSFCLALVWSESRRLSVTQLAGRILSTASKDCLTQ